MTTWQFALVIVVAFLILVTCLEAYLRRQDRQHQEDEAQRQQAAEFRQRQALEFAATHPSRTLPRINGTTPR